MFLELEKYVSHSSRSLLTLTLKKITTFLNFIKNTINNITIKKLQLKGKLQNYKNPTFRFTREPHEA